MVYVLDSVSAGPGLSPGRDTALCSQARNFTLIVPLFDGLGSHAGGSRNTPSHF